jgi:hypothetical protein
MTRKILGQDSSEVEKKRSFDQDAANKPDIKME